MSKIQYDDQTQTITIPEVKGAEYYIDDLLVEGTVTIDDTTTVHAKPSPGRRFAKDAETSWTFEVPKQSFDYTSQV